MLSILLFYFFGLLGLIAHVLFKVMEDSKENALLAVWVYVTHYQVKTLFAWLTYTIIYAMWVGKAIPALEGFSLWFSPVIAYMANSMWGHWIGSLSKRFKNNATQT